MTTWPDGTPKSTNNAFTCATPPSAAPKRPVSLRKISKTANARARENYAKRRAAAGANI